METNKIEEMKMPTCANNAKLTYEPKDESNWSELKIQTEAFQWLWHNRPETRRCLYHVANEGERSVMETQQLIAAGMVPGTQDLHFLWKGRTYLIEAKTPQGEVSPAQKCVHAAHKQQGFDTYLFRSAYSIVAFVCNVIESDRPLWHSSFISPYCRPELLPQYIEEYQTDQRRKANKRRK